MTTPSVTVNGDFQALTGASTGFVKVKLANFTGVPTVTSTGVIIDPMIQTAVGSSFSLSLWGKEQITPNNTWYVFSFFDASENWVADVPYQLSAGSYDISAIASLMYVPGSGSVPTTPQYTLTGTFEAVTGTSNGYCTIQLINLDTLAPMVKGAGVIIQPTLTTMVGGNFSATIYGNDQITTPSGSCYQMTFYNASGVQVGQSYYSLAGSGADISALTPIANPPTSPSLNLPPVTVNPAVAYVPTSTTVNGHALGSNVVVSASDITTGTLPHAQLPALVAGDIPNIAESQVTSLLSDLAGKVPTTTTVNGHALSANVTISASDITTGTLPHAQLPALVGGDIPNNTANTSGTAAGLSANIAESQVTNLVADLASKVPQTFTVNGHALSGNIAISASDLTTGILPHAQLPALVAGDIPNIAESQVTNLTTDLANRVLNTTTVNGHALSSNITISASDITAGTLPRAQLPALVSGDIPNNAANTSGTAANLSGTPALPNGATATTQAVNDNTTKIATDAFVIGQASSTNPVMNGSVAIGTSTTFARADHVHASDTSRAPITTTVNGHSLSGNVVVSASDLTTGNLPIAQIPTGGSSTTYLRGDGSWVTPPGAGNVTGPSSSTSGNLPSFNGTTGQLIQDSGIAASSVATQSWVSGNYQAALGFTPVQQGGGFNQAGDKVYIGWSAAGLRLTVDSSDLGVFFATGVNPPVAAFSTSTAGYIKFYNGFMIQWGTQAVSNNGTAFNFPTSFPNACLGGCISDTGASGSAGFYNYTASQYKVWASHSSTFTWVAVGY